MFNAYNKGPQVSLPLDPAHVTGDITIDQNDTYLKGLVEGAVVTLDANGVKLFDGAVVDGSLTHVGFLVRNALAYPYENVPGIASGSVAVAYGNFWATTDQIDTTKTYVPGQALYAGTTTMTGKLTNVAPDPDAKKVGIATSAASLSSPQLSFIAIG